MQEEAEADAHGKDARDLEPDDREELAAEINRLRTEIDSTRDELGLYISELDRRRHEALDLKVQMKRHPGVVLGIGLGIAAVVAGGIILAVRSRRRETIGRRVQRSISRVAPAPLEKQAKPSRVLDFLLKSALPLGIGGTHGFLPGLKKRRVA
ncbi:MAG: hypothetical protein ABIQ65_10960 [Thermoanaerobaculia bacterium]